jgi:aspartyl-tRNA(Asn)/glutamyl-tRNA(Gln) amidotransferase subunit A
MAIDDYLRLTGRKPGQFLFAGRGDDEKRGLTTRQYARLVQEWLASMPEMLAAVERLRERFAASGLNVENRRSPIDFKRLFEIQRMTMLYEASRAMQNFTALAPGQIGEKLLAAIAEGNEISESAYLDRRREIDLMRRAFLAATAGIDGFLWPAAPGPAPKGLGWTGDPKYISPWTAIGGPIITVPSGFTRAGLPLGCILCGKPGADAALAEVASRTLA